jgi:acetyl esterase/lipase
VTSWAARKEIAWARLQRKRRFYSSSWVMRRQLSRRQHDSRASPPAEFWDEMSVETSRLGGQRCYSLAPITGVRRQLHIFHLHGGGFVEQPETHHWRFARRVVESLGCRYTLPMYALAPAHDYRDIVPAAIEAYARAMSETPDMSKVLFGDSAGGSLCLTIAQQLRETGGQQPACMALFSPWLNLATDHPLSEAIAPHDPELGIAGLQQAARWYAADDEINDPKLSPAHAHVDGLAPMSVFVGTRDLLLPDALALEADCRQAGVPLDMHIFDGMFHNWMMKQIPEAETATRQLIQFIYRHTSTSMRRSVDDRTYDRPDYWHGS